jgi:hypothetical protein
MTMLPLYSSSAFGATTQDTLNILINLDHSSMGPTPKRVSLAVRHLCGLLMPSDELKPIRHEEFYEVAREYYQQIKSADRSGTELLIFLAYVSGFFHEIRHVHDLLATTYGQDLLVVCLNYYQNTPALVHALHAWLEKDTTRRVPLPLAGNLDRLPGFPDDFKELVAQFPKKKADIKAFQHPTMRSPADLTVTHLLEGSAINVQLDFVYDVFGAEGLFLLTQFIQRGNRSRIYLQIRQELEEVFHAKKFQGWGLGRLINYLLWCSLMRTALQGQKLRDGPNPVLLFEALAQHVARNVNGTEIEIVRKAVQEFYSRWKFLDQADVVVTQKKTIAERLEMFEQKSQELGAQSPFAKFYQAYRAFGAAFSTVNEDIANSPELYFGQRLYVWTFLRGLYPSVKISAMVDGSVQSFMSRGYPLISFEDWEWIAMFSSAFRLIVEGRDCSGFAFYDDICFQMLTEGVSGAPLRFEDRGPLFVW